MGTIKQGILGGFSGKVGAVIGASWKGINYMRSIPQHVKNPRTAGQVSQRSKKAAHPGSFFSYIISTTNQQNKPKVYFSICFMLVYRK